MHPKAVKCICNTPVVKSKTSTVYKTTKLANSQLCQKDVISMQKSCEKCAPKKARVKTM